MLNDYDWLMNAAQSRTPLLEAEAHQASLAIGPQRIRSQHIPQLGNHYALFRVTLSLFTWMTFSLLSVSVVKSLTPPPHRFPRAMP